ncbi:MAG: hypothetical protein IPO88_08865 [Nannocystis sp.]|uniref:hypothetical protein n=1 Tax=Nannocystis sp. TaxID=1962667 RepID=UPI002427ECDF|nr:hypothetical protein [Nannocystis sp.]MBK9753604.1 hypothetical protein [Nannocystis sp.]
MLAAAEAHYAAALQAALAPGAAILSGPAPTIPAGASVQVLAEQLRLAPPSQDLGDERGAARHFTAQSWQGDGVTTSFPLPPGALEVAEVEAPPGFPRARGDDYRVDAGTLRFSRPPAMGIGVRALLLGAPARGFVERRRGELTLRLRARAATGLDELAEAALAAALTACVDLPDLVAAATAGVRARLCRPVAFLVAVTRQRERVGEAERACVELEFLLRGEALLHVALGVPDPVDRIKSVEPGVVDVG